MWRKAFLAGVCLCLRWAAALGGESRDGTGSAPGARTGHGAPGLQLPALPAAFGKGELGGKRCRRGGKGEFAVFSFVKLSRGAWDAAGPGLPGLWRGTPSC